MILKLIDKQDLLAEVKTYIDSCGGVLNGEGDTQNILRMIEQAEVKSTWVVKDRNR